MKEHKKLTEWKISVPVFQVFFQFNDLQSKLKKTNVYAEIRKNTTRITTSNFWFRQLFMLFPKTNSNFQNSNPQVNNLANGNLSIQYSIISYSEG